MTDLPRFGQRSTTPRQEQCPKHPGRQAVAYCKRCNRPACADCAIPTEVGSICVDCANPNSKQRWRNAGKTGWLARSQAPVTTVLIIINVVLFIVEKVWPPIFQYLAMTPLIAVFQPWRLMTTGFLHAGFFHLLFNMFMLYLLGAAVEKVFGWWRYLAIYLLSVLGGSAAVLAWTLVQPDTLNVATVGASGALYGMFGAIFIVQRKSGISTTSILILLGINLAYSFMVRGVSWQAHIGGFLVGLAVTAIYFAVMERTRTGGSGAQTRWSLIMTALMVAALGASTWGLLELVSGVAGI